jgi:hypothetical protein
LCDGERVFRLKEARNHRFYATSGAFWSRLQSQPPANVNRGLAKFAGVIQRLHQLPAA